MSKQFISTEEQTDVFDWDVYDYDANAWYNAPDIVRRLCLKVPVTINGDEANMERWIDNTVCVWNDEFRIYADWDTVVNVILNHGANFIFVELPPLDSNLDMDDIPF